MMGAVRLTEAVPELSKGAMGWVDANRRGASARDRA